MRSTEPRKDVAHQQQDVRIEDGVQYGDDLPHCDVRYVARVKGATLCSAAQAPGTLRGARLLSDRLTDETAIV